MSSHKVDVTLNNGITVTEEYCKPYIRMEGKNRILCHYLVNNLTKDTEYLISISIDSKKYPDYHFKTLTDTRTVKIAMGGDAGNNYSTDKFLKLLGTTVKPELIALGGDVMYDNGMKTCYCSVDRFLNEFYKALKGDNNHLVPYIFGIGNHETGWVRAYDLANADFVPHYF
jgi:hypothetical protein